MRYSYHNVHSTAITNLTTFLYESCYPIYLLYQNFFHQNSNKLIETNPKNVTKKSKNIIVITEGMIGLCVKIKKNFPEFRG